MTEYVGDTHAILWGLFKQLPKHCVSACRSSLAISSFARLAWSVWFGIDTNLNQPRNTGTMDAHEKTDPRISAALQRAGAVPPDLQL